MSKRILIQKGKDSKGEEETNLLKLEVLELKEIADIIFKRLEEKIEVLKALEASANEKIAVLERLIQEAKSIKSTDRQEEVISLAESGIKASEIADMLGMPVGEVELILNLRGQKPR